MGADWVLSLGALDLTSGGSLLLSSAVPVVEIAGHGHKAAVALHGEV